MFRKLLDDPDCAVAECDGSSPPPLAPGEEAFVENAVPKRRRQFAAGRGCARAALHALGHEAQGVPILRGDKREPVWPAGFAGSITHTEGHCAAAVVRVGRLVGVGIDVERGAPLDDALLERICSPDERAAVDALATRGERERGAWGKVVFSAKEAFYKAYYPLGGLVLGFGDAHVELDAEASSFRATLHESRPSFAGHRTLIGRFGFGPDHVFTAVTVPHDPPT